VNRVLAILTLLSITFAASSQNFAIVAVGTAFLNFPVNPASPNQLGQSFNVTSTGSANATFQTSVQTSNGTGWLSASTNGAPVTPCAVNVTIDRTLLPTSGTASGSITITTSPTAPAITIPVTVTMSNPMTVSPASWNVTTDLGTAAVPPLSRNQGVIDLLGSIGFAVFPPIGDFLSIPGSPQPPPAFNLLTHFFTPTAATVRSYTAVLNGSPVFSLDKASGNLPATLTARVAQAITAPGTYSANLVITVSGATPPSFTAPLKLTVTPTLVPALKVSVPAISLNGSQGATSLTSQLQILNSGGGQPVLKASSSTSNGGSWLSIRVPSSPVSNTSPEVITITANLSGLVPGTYRGSITFGALSSGTVPSPVPVTLTVNAVAQALLLTNRALAFSGSTAAPIPAQTIFVSNTGMGSLSWSATALGGSWLQLSPSKGNANPGSGASPLTVSVNPLGLAPGFYSGTIQVTSPTSSNSPQNVSVMLTVRPKNGAPPEPALSDYGITLVTDTTAGGSSASQTVKATNMGGPALTFATIQSTNDGANWLKISPANGSVAGGGTTPLFVSVDSTGLTAGSRKGSVRVLFSDGTVHSLTVNLATISGTLTAKNCNATNLIPQAASLESNFDVNALNPYEFRALVLDNCGNPVSSGSLQASFSNGDPALALTPVGNGVWSATWQPGNPANPVQVRLTALQSVTNLTGSSFLTGEVMLPEASLTLIRAVVNSANNSSDGQISPGQNFTIYGDQLANDTEITSSTPWPTSLAGTSVILNGVSLPLLFASPRQINAIVPFGVTVNTQQQLLIQRAGVNSVPVSVTITDSQPAIYSINQQGSGQGSVLVSGTASLAAPMGTVPNARPVHRNEYLEIYCTGFGDVSNPPADGGPAASAEPLARTKVTPTVTLGGQPVQLLYSGLAPGLIGIYQINIAVGTAVPVGDAVPLVVTLGNQTANTVTVAVQQ
jgi:uncharacterized protein (TIGR03437 family)